MPRKKKERGRPMVTKYPPRIDATPEQVARALFATGVPEGAPVGLDYRCADCGREVAYPETLYGDGRCEGCHGAVV